MPNSCSSHRYQFSKFIALDEEISVATATQENSQDLPLNVVKLIIGTSQFLREVCVSYFRLMTTMATAAAAAAAATATGDGNSDGGDEAVVTVVVVATTAAAMVALAIMITPLHVITLSDVRVQRVKENQLRKKCPFYLVQPMCITLND